MVNRAWRNGVFKKAHQPDCITFVAGPYLSVSMRPKVLFTSSRFLVA
jgi:hypothetical protein